MAFLLGSWATDRACKESDSDIAIYFKPMTGRLELIEKLINSSGEKR